ncbi:unnamed protein product [Prorocentrum cordatum]|uniref:Uncharacterized protein n=1 Tax=Prorocentrum cordatum TaxID=2364126 RepID=A0ABN9X554_9DINO|nr:unnamed protein product [Polarella glacialis]
MEGVESRDPPCHGPTAGGAPGSPPVGSSRAGLQGRVSHEGFCRGPLEKFPAVAGPGGLQEGFAEARRASTRPPAFSEARPPSQKAASFAPVHCLYCRRRWTMVEHPDWLS